MLSKSIVVHILGVLLLLVGCGGGTPDERSDNNASTTVAAASASEVQRFCGSCHIVPDPAAFPAEYWREKVVDGFGFYRQSGRSDLVEPSMEGVVAYYEQHAPSAFTMPDIERVAEADSGGVFAAAEEIRLGEPLAAVSNILGVEDGESRVLFTSDMRTGSVWKTDLNSDRTTVELVRGLNPCRIAPVQFTADQAGFVVSDLGSFFPEDHAQGDVLWVVPGDDPAMQPTSLFLGAGRVADARPADFDADGDIDIVVAEFG